MCPLHIQQAAISTSASDRKYFREQVLQNALWNVTLVPRKQVLNKSMVSMYVQACMNMVVGKWHNNTPSMVTWYSYNTIVFPLSKMNSKIHLINTYMSWNDLVDNAATSYLNLFKMGFLRQKQDVSPCFELYKIFFFFTEHSLPHVIKNYSAWY